MVTASNTKSKISNNNNYALLMPLQLTVLPVLGAKLNWCSGKHMSCKPQRCISYLVFKVLVSLLMTSLDNQFCDKNEFNTVGLLPILLYNQGQATKSYRRIFDKQSAINKLIVQRTCLIHLKDSKLRKTSYDALCKDELHTGNSKDIPNP